MLFLAVLVVSVSGAGAHSYRRPDPQTGQMLECARCPPGTRLRAHCTRSRQTECVACAEGQFTEFWNYIPNCLLCDACADHQRVVHPCNASANTVCECESGFYWDQHFCRRHRACAPGHGLKAPGTAHSDAVCEVCADGQFADVSQAQAVCVSHRVCHTHEHLLLPGARWHDNICVSCQQLDHRDWAEVLSPLLWGLHLREGAWAAQLKLLVRRRLNKQPQRFRKRALRWSDSNPDLRELPPTLSDSYVSQMANRIVHSVRSLRRTCSNSLSR